MELTASPDDDALADPLRARLFDALGEPRRPATTQELATRVERHPNTTRIQLHAWPTRGSSSGGSRVSNAAGRVTSGRSRETPSLRAGVPSGTSS
jgi:hypothetical protein